LNSSMSCHYSFAALQLLQAENSTEMLLPVEGNALTPQAVLHCYFGQTL